jgi:hypothetical protein
MRKFCTLLIGIFGALAISVSLADDASMAAAFKQFIATPDSPIVLRGDYLRAVTTAYRDFSTSKTFRSARQDARARVEMEDYDFSVDLTAKSFIVQFGPKVRGDPSHVVFGGGARYEIDRASFKIVDRTGLK